MTPEEVKTINESTKETEEVMAEANAHPGPSYTVAQCRADVDAWTLTGDTVAEVREMLTGATVVIVGGKNKMLPFASSHLNVSQLQNRVYELSICEDKDLSLSKVSDFQYQLIREQYQREIEGRYLYFIASKNLFDQFTAADKATHR